MKILILGLRRSGTTLFFDILSQDPRFVCLYEPFNPLLNNIVDDDWVRKFPTLQALRQLWETNPGKFWESFSPISTLEEIQAGLSDRQIAYLRYLLDGQEHVLLDTTRCHFKVAALHAVMPDTWLIHLYRPPGANATSHLLPSSRYVDAQADSLHSWFLGLRNFIRDRVHRHTFFTRTNGYNYWRFEEIVGKSPHSLFGHRLREIGLDAEEVYALPAVGRLLAYWRVNYERIENDGRHYFKERFFSLNFDHFCQDAAATASSIFDWLGIPRPELDFGKVHLPRGPYQPHHRQWQALASKLKLPFVD